MNKKEKSAYDAMAHHIQVAASLHITPLVEPDVHVGGISGAVIRDDGWVPSRYISQFIVPRRSEKGYPVYSTRLLALQAARNEEERSAGMTLAKIDAAIALELAGSRANTEN